MSLKSESKMRGELRGYLRTDYSPADMKSLLERWKESGMFAQVQIEGGRETYLVLAEDITALESLENGKVLKSWNPKETTTLEEVTFLASLDVVSARGRAMKLFDFDYKWEVYVPAHKRRWGYYVLPILYGDDLLARLDPKLDRTTMTLEIKGFWHEDDAPVQDVHCANALAKGLVRFAKFVGAKKIKITMIKPLNLQKHVQRLIKDF